MSMGMGMGCGSRSLSRSLRFLICAMLLPSFLLFSRHNHFRLSVRPMGGDAAVTVTDWLTDLLGLRA